MNKETYLQIRNNNSIEPFYEFYKENWNKEKHIFLLNPEQFFQSINMWPNAQQAYQDVLAYYDTKFELMSIKDLETGQILKYY